MKGLHAAKIHLIICFECTISYSVLHDHCFNNTTVQQEEQIDKCQGLSERTPNKKHSTPLKKKTSFSDKLKNTTGLDRCNRLLNITACLPKFAVNQSSSGKRQKYQKCLLRFSGCRHKNREDT